MIGEIQSCSIWRIISLTWKLKVSTLKVVRGVIKYKIVKADPYKYKGWSWVGWSQVTKY